DARDALLAAAYARDRKDFAIFWQAFAKRGAGVGASAPDPFSLTNAGVVESYTAGGALSLWGVGLYNGLRTCDSDQILDAGETWQLIINLHNDGAVLLHNTTATVTSTNPAVTFPNGNTINFQALHPGDAFGALIRVGLAAGTTGKQRVRFVISFSD